MISLARTLGATTLVAAAVCCGVSAAAAQRSPAQDSADVVAARSAFHRALVAGDSAAVLLLLAPDVRIVESGSVQTRDEYRSEHLSSDIAYARAVPSTTTSMRVTVVGDVAWITSITASTGEFNGRAVNSLGAELMVLRRVDGQAGRRWMIDAVHWSSRRKPAGS